MANVSLTGAYLETRMTLRLLALVYLQSESIKGEAVGKRFAASVVRHDARGVGLEWCEPQTKASGVTALVATLAAPAADEIAGIPDRHYRFPGSREERATQSGGARNS